MIFHDNGLLLPDLAILARTNKRISSIVLPVLYRQIVQHFNGGKELSRRAERLRRTIYECPALAALIKTLIVKCWTIDDVYDKFMADLIQRLCSLQELTFTVHYHGYHSRFKEYKNFRKTLKSGVCSNLRMIKIGYLYISCNEISRYMCFPNMRTLVVQYTKRRSYGLKERLALDGRQSFLKVFEIYLDSSRILGLLDMLSCCRALEKFSCHLQEDFANRGHGYNAEDDEPSDGEDEQRQHEDDPELLDAPAMIPRALTHCQQTLVSLDLYWIPLRNEMRPGPSPLNPASFTNLKSLRSSAYLLLSYDERWHIPTRNKFYERIPPSLESLTILFPRSFGVFAVFNANPHSEDDDPPYKDEHRIHDIDLNGPYATTDLEWVIAIARMKKTHLNHLNKVDLIDYKDVHKHCDDPSACLAPKVVRLAFDAASINFAMPSDSATI